jgi:hypothetical protein
MSDLKFSVGRESIVPPMKMGLAGYFNTRISGASQALVFLMNTDNSALITLAVGIANCRTAIGRTIVHADYFIIAFAFQN